MSEVLLPRHAMAGAVALMKEAPMQMRKIAPFIIASTMFLTACGGGVSLSSYIQPYLNKAASVAQNLDVKPLPDCAVGDLDCDPFGG